ncbi:hypothetical protein [Cohnella fermenti]|uniref:Uncharacterized protein n=1 Tax=Cohnella fermenti TaxID=2565925 RepID=A0A4S4BWT3_9BACL|nr:hypothetical protein [Cohnella fermenti]THF77552.1 hypothetical protein E6C55_16175 [Cohnella fermenti]
MELADAFGIGGEGGAMWVAVIAAAIVVLIIAGATFRRRRRTRAGNPKLVSLEEVRRAKRRSAGRSPEAKPQHCSLCRRPAGRLSFYVDERGGTIGVCRACKPKAEARDLDRL